VQGQREGLGADEGQLLWELLHPFVLADVHLAEPHRPDKAEAGCSLLGRVRALGGRDSDLVVVWHHVLALRGSKVVFSTQHRVALYL